ncbi:MAG TPA: RNA polymerase sigma factor [Candidatus Magasanikbacteria bacterium]|nr:RNA polymerase sigma factor [Candidatus Magasanikbacteria bacterium]
MSIQSELQEKWLLYQLKVKKDPQAFGRLYDLYASKIYRFIYFKVSSVADAEDLTAEVFLKTWEHISTGKEVKKFAALLYRIARNKVIDFYRHRQVAGETPIDELMLKKLSDEGNMAKNLETLNEAESIIKSLRNLKDEYREALTLRFVDELSVGEIAEILGKTPVNTRVLLHRALNTLKKVVDEKNKN